MKRRQFLKLAGVYAGGAMFVPYVSKAADAAKPNVLIIQTDEHNFRTLGCYRKTLSDEQAFMWGEKAVVETPNIDWIADNGVLCTKFYATTPVCSPSRSSFVSGQYPQNTPVITNDIPMSDDVVTFAELLGRAGYSTGYSGKWHLDGKGKPQWEPERKFGFEDNRYMFNRGHWKLLQDTPNGPAAGMVNGKPDYKVIGDKKTFTTDFLADKTVEFIEKNKGKPFCYMVSIPDPHGPDTVRSPYKDMYSGMKFEKARTYDRGQKGVPSWAKAESKASVTQDRYFGMVRCIDDNVGKILDYLRKNNLMDNTIVIFTSDHGDMRGEHHRENKGIPLEASAKVPFIMYYKGKVEPGSIVREALSCVDFLPTLCGMLGVKTAGREEGRDASALLLNGKAPGGWKDVAFMRGTNSWTWISALTTRYKLILSPQDTPWLVDMKEDPDEIKNFCFDAGHRDVVKDLGSELLAYAKKYNDPCFKIPKVQADLEWAVSGEGEYKAPDMPASKSGGKAKRAKREKK